MATLYRALGLALLLAIPAMAQPVTVEPGISLALAQWRAAHIGDVSYTLHFDLPADPQAPIPARVAIQFTLDAPGDGLQLDFREQGDKLRAVTSNGKPVGYRFRDEHILLPATALRRGRNSVQIEFIAGDSSLNRNPDYLYTLFVPDRARTAFPLFDQPDLKAHYQLSLSLPANWQALANAPLMDKKVDGERQHLQFARTEPLSSYLFSFVAGEFQVVQREVAGRSMTLLHRETDTDKVARNLDAVFDLHGQALSWLEDYTGIDYPYAKLDFALLPDFQYSGMEHPGAIQYKAAKLLLDPDPTDKQLMDRASLIAHEVAHMWFGNLVTMAWFNDVWTKEVFANFMAAKIIHPAYPGIDHDLNFLVRHYPGAYSVDRTAGANPIRQHLPNLDQAGQLYGEIIYKKAPIMMRQLELLIGEKALREGLREYLQHHAHSNATWPQLIAILDRRTPTDLEAWSEAWVNSADRPAFELYTAPGKAPVLVQQDPRALGRNWPQQFSIRQGSHYAHLEVTGSHTSWPAEVGVPTLFNSDALGYGLFPADPRQLADSSQLTDLERGALLINLYEQFLNGSIEDQASYTSALLQLAVSEQNQLLLDLLLKQLSRLFDSLLQEPVRENLHRDFEQLLWQRLLLEADRGRARIVFASFTDQAKSPDQIQRVYDLWRGKLSLDTVTLSEPDRIRLAEILAIRLPDLADSIFKQQRSETSNPDQLRRLSYLAPALSAEVAVRDSFFSSLTEAKNRTTETWVLDALRHLHHPSRVEQSQRYIADSLILLEEIQRTGDIFFPAKWLEANLENHHSPDVVATVQKFLAARQDYNPQLTLKIQQAVDLPLRAATLSRDLSGVNQ